MIRVSSRFVRLWQGRVAESSQDRHLTTIGSRITSIAVCISAALLVIASAGYGAIYAFSQAKIHGAELIVFALAMALGLECAKPFAIEAAFSSMRRLAIGRALAMAALGIAAVAYSLTAELSLMATTRGDKVAERAAQAEAAEKAKARYERAERELASLPPARPAGELQALIDGVLMNPKAGGCATLDGPFTRQHCPKVAEWRAEVGRADQRARLEAAMREAEQDQNKAPAIKSPDAGASALATYLSTIGLPIPAPMLSEWLVLIAVVALELGSAFSVLLVRSVQGHEPAQSAHNAAVGAHEIASLAALSAPKPGQQTTAQPENARTDAVDREKPGAKPVAGSKAKSSRPRRDRRLGQAHRRVAVDTKTAAEHRIVDTLAGRGGRLDGASVRGIARLIGAKRGTTYNALAALIAAGVVARAGGELVLTAAT